MHYWYSMSPKKLDTSNVTCKLTYAEGIHKSLLVPAKLPFKSLSSNFHVAFLVKGKLLASNSELTFQLLSRITIKQGYFMVTLLQSYVTSVQFVFYSYCTWTKLHLHKPLNPTAWFELFWNLLQYCFGVATRDIVVHFQFYHHNTKVVTKVGHDVLMKLQMRCRRSIPE